MIEIFAAVAGASLSWAAMGSIGRSSRAQSQQEAERKEFYGRLNSVEQRVSKLEAQPRI
jgi:hypothetical protein